MCDVIQSTCLKSPDFHLLWMRPAPGQNRELLRRGGRTSLLLRHGEREVDGVGEASLCSGSGDLQGVDAGHGGVGVLAGATGGSCEQGGGEGEGEKRRYASATPEGDGREDETSAAVAAGMPGARERCGLAWLM
jgi:hypothetical protein